MFKLITYLCVGVIFRVKNVSSEIVDIKMWCNSILNQHPSRQISNVMLKNIYSFIRSSWLCKQRLITWLDNQPIHSAEQWRAVERNWRFKMQKNLCHLYKIMLRWKDRNLYKYTYCIYWGNISQPIDLFIIQYNLSIFVSVYTHIHIYISHTYTYITYTYIYIT